MHRVDEIVEHIERRIIPAFANIIDGIVVLWTLGFYHPWLSFRVTVWSVERQIKRKIDVSS